jgi:hypothetical protein
MNGRFHAYRHREYKVDAERWDGKPKSKAVVKILDFRLGVNIMDFLDNKYEGSCMLGQDGKSIFFYLPSSYREVYNGKILEFADTDDAHHSVEVSVSLDSHRRELKVDKATGTPKRDTVITDFDLGC